MATIKRNLANSITIIGILSCFVLARLIGWHREIVPIFWWSLFIAATDLFDGIVARRTAVTVFGTYADKLRDKLLEGNLLAFFIIDQRIDLWVKVIAIPLGIAWALLNGVWFAALIRHQKVKANDWGKRKMFIFCITALVYLAYLAALVERAVAIAFAVVLFCAVMSFISNRAKYNHDLSQH